MHRRTILCGTGVSLAHPRLESVAPRARAACYSCRSGSINPVSRGKRLSLSVHFGRTRVTNQWRPARSGTAGSLTIKAALMEKRDGLVRGFMEHPLSDSLGRKLEAHDTEHPE